MRFWIIVILISSNFILNSQNGFKVRPYAANSSNNSSAAIFEVTSGVYMGAGFVTDTTGSVNTNQIAIMELNGEGQVQWLKKYGNNKIKYLNNKFISRCFYKQDSFLYYAGCATDTAGTQIGVFIKFNMNGDTLWQRTYRDSVSIDFIPQIVTASVDNGFLITGFFQNWITHTRQGLILKTDANGNELWRKKINKLTPNVQDGKAIVQDSTSKKIVIAGYQYINGSDNQDNILILDSLGNVLTRTKYCTFGGYPKDLIQTKDKKFIMIGWQYYPQTIGGNNVIKSFAVKFDIDSPSIPIWKIDGFDKLGLYNGFICLKELKNGNILIGGILDTMQGVWNGPNNLPGNALTRLTLVDKDGNITWNRYYNYKVNDAQEQNNQGIRSIELCQDGSWLAAIECNNYPGVNPFLFVKYDSTGCDSSAAHCATLNLVGVEKVRNNNAEVRIYPNPAKDFLYVDTNSPVEIKMSFVDIYGREVKKVRLEQKAKIDVSSLIKGIYFLRVFDQDNLIATEKIIKNEKSSTLFILYNCV